MYVSSEFLVAAWRTIYWCSFALTWALIPLLQAYTQSGEFTVMKRIRSAVRYNILYQLVVGSIALLGLVYVWYAQGTSNLRAYIMALSNSWGLILVVIFMGYGMVDVPRRLWHQGDNARELRRISFKASVVKDKRQDTEDEVLSVAKELSVVCHKLQLSDPLRVHVDRMVADFPAVRGVQFESSRTSSPIPRNDAAGGANTGGATSGPPTRPALVGGIAARKHSMDGLVPAIITEKYLADLHARIKRALRMKDRWTAIWHDLLKAGFLAQDIQENADNPEKKFRSTLRPLGSKPKDWRLSLEWHWHLNIRPVLLKSASVICAALSLLIVWSEMTYQNVNPILSVIGLLVQIARQNVSYGSIEAISFLTMCYMCTCAYTTLMKMKLLNNYVLVPNHHTDEPTLLFIGSYLCRLTFPLVYNYLTISTIGKEDSTIFAQYMGKIDMVPFLGEFNYYMPYVILVPTLITLFNVFAKMFAICSISDNFFDNDDDEGGIGGDLEEGQQVLKDARRDEERRLMPDRSGVNRDFTARRGAAFETYNTNKSRRRGDAHGPSHGVLGDGSSANAWRDVRPHPSGSSQRPYGDAYFDDSTDDDDSSSVFAGFGRRDSMDHFGTGGANVGGVRGSFETPSRLGNSSTRNSQRNIAALDPPSSSEPGPLKSIWQKIIKPKQAIALEGADTPNLIDNDGARSSTESTGHDSHPPSLTAGGQGYRPDRFASAARSGPALMFASVQQQPRSSHGDADRDRLLSVGESRIPSSRSGSHSRGHSPQPQTRVSQPGAPGTNRPSSTSNRPSGRAFGPSASGQPSRSTGGSHSQRQSSPLVNIFDDEDD
ncbi:hypothetical protein EMPS_02322 [Entomortierella parvispora]|uniref:Uncharacterized protein n=1 Tax=Entomortierella parvispora TaxID=205924 RepID=A0A9P3H576_9FUNG|nr:hypothetical protein EMPS_02322 [Entomortierella parvispora]